MQKVNFPAWRPYIATGMLCIRISLYPQYSSLGLSHFDSLVQNPVNWYGCGSHFTQVNNNGMVSFTSGVGAFFATPFPLNGTQELIAVYWTDVDTSTPNSGTVWYRETTDATLIRRFRNEIRRAFSTQRTFSPLSLFIATWDHVGYYFRQFDKVITLMHYSV